MCHLVILGIFSAADLKLEEQRALIFTSKPLDLGNLGSLKFCDANQFIKSVTYYLKGSLLHY